MKISRSLPILLLILSGCAERAYLVEPGTAIRNAQKVTSKAWVPNAAGKPIKATIEYPVGATVTVPTKYISEEQFLKEANERAEKPAEKKP